MANGNIEQRLAQLESESGELKRQVASLLSSAAVPKVEPVVAVPQTPRRLDEARVEILHPVDAAPPEPPEKELRSLLAIVVRAYPDLRTNELEAMWGVRNDDPDGFLAFREARRGVMAMGRCQKPNGKYGVTYWVGDRQEWLSARGIHTRVTGKAFIAACLSAGDVAYVPYNGSVGNLWEFGLEPYSGGRPAKHDAWRAIVSAGKLLLAPSKPDRPEPMPSVAQVRAIG